MSFGDDEVGVESSQPRELFEITHGPTAYRFNSGQRPIVYGGNVYMPFPAGRMDLPVDSLSTDSQFVIVVPATHALVARWLAAQTPPQRVVAVVRRLQVNSNEVSQIWAGEITSLSFEGNEARFLVPSRAQRSMQRRLPTVLVDFRCGAILYDSWCTVDRASNTYAAHITAVDGRNVNVTFDVTYPAGDTWALRGQFIHLASEEPMLIIGQSAAGLSLVLQSSIYGMRVGDHVTVSKGCDHSLQMCHDVFDNVLNYVGLPARPTRNPFFPWGTGIGESK